MRYLIVYILLVIFTDDINEIATINRVKDEAARAYNNGDYGEAIKSYSFLYDSLGENNDKILLNLSNAYFKAQDTSNAQFHYAKLTESGDKSVKSIAHQQLGVIATNTGKYDVALEEFKNSLRADPGNNDARYNYELLKRLMEENQQQQNQDQQNKDQQNQDQQNQDQQDQNQDQQQQDQENEEEQDQEQQQNQQNPRQEQEQQEEQQQQEQQESEEENQEEQVQPQPQETEEMEISEEMAKMILEALRNNEIQYIQQNKKKAKKPKDNSKPDW
jgi:hypothetical protein